MYEKLFKKEGTAYTGMRRMEKIRSDMSEIYQTLYRGHTAKNTTEGSGDFADFQVERKIVAAFYDAGILNNAERDYFQTQAFQTVNAREQICVEEANVLAETATAQKADAQVKSPLARNIRQ